MSLRGATLQSSQKENENEDLKLFGSQINLSTRPRDTSGRASARSMIVSGVHARRPMSALPSLGHSDRRTYSISLSDKWRRPQSADCPYSPVSSSLTRSDSVASVTVMKPPVSDSDPKESQTSYRKNKLAANFTLLDSTKNISRNECAAEFRSTYTLPSAMLLESLKNDGFGETWGNEEIKRSFRNDRRASCNYYGSDNESDFSCSEQSLGERIIALAQQPHPDFIMQPGVTTKPPLPPPNSVRTSGSDECPQPDDNTERRQPLKLQDLVSSLNSAIVDWPLAVCSTAWEKGDKLETDTCLLVNTSEQPFIDSADGTRENVAKIPGDLGKEKVPCKKYVETVKESFSFSVKNNNIEQDYSLIDLKFEQWFPDSCCYRERAVVSKPLNSNLEGEEQNELVLQSLTENPDQQSPRVGKNIVENEQLNQEASSKDSQLKATVTRDIDDDVDSLIHCLSGTDLKSCLRSHGCNDTIIKTDKQELDLQAPETAQLMAGVDHTTAESELKYFSQELTRSVSALVEDGEKQENVRSSLLNDDVPVRSFSKHESPEHDTGMDSLWVSSNSQITGSEKGRNSSIDTEVVDNVCENDFSVNTHSSETRPTSRAIRLANLNTAIADPAVNSTYDEIVNILKVLEEEEAYSLLHMEDLKLDATSDLGSMASDGDAGPQLQQAAASGKLKDILTYLDEVNQCCNTVIDSARSRIQEVKDTNRNSELKLTSMPRLEELLNMSSVDLAHEVLTLKLQLEERSNSMAMLQQALNQQRELTLRNSRNSDKELKRRLKEQKQEYEAIINRHQKFVDQLIADKKTLSDKCQALVSELKTCEERHAANCKAMMERHAIELQKAKEMHAAAEKLRRERWIDNKTQKIKELTVKGLEPELVRMSTRHQQEVQDLRAAHQRELQDVEQAAARRADILRSQLAAETEEALAKEREAGRQRLERMAVEQEQAYQEERRRLLAEVRRDKERLAAEEARVRQDAEDACKALERDHARVVERLHREHQEALEVAERRHASALKNLREACEVEKEAWAHNYRKQQEVVLAQRESEIRDRCKRDRDREIELVIERLESEAAQSQAEKELAAENRLRRLNEKFEAEVKDFEASEAALKAKYSDVKNKLVEKEDEVINLKANVRQLEKELEEVRKITDRLSGERAEVKDLIRKEFEVQVSVMDRENVKIREEMAEIRVRHQLELAGKSDEIAKVTAEKEKVLQEVYNRVRVAVSRKDETIQQLKRQHEAALERCCHLENLLEQQRKDYLLK